MTASRAAGRLEAEASRLASDHFGGNLILAFIGGSYAGGVPHPGSDVDLFAVLGKPDRDAEMRFAMDFLKLHERHSLTLSHCGEVFSRTTLEHLMTVTERILEQVPEIQHVGCYHGDCILSVFRKGDVVFKFLADPKTLVSGDQNYLSALEERARTFFRRFPMPRVQLEKGRLAGLSRTVSNLGQAYHAAQLTPAYADTPGGIGLERWFGPNIVPEYQPPAGPPPASLAVSPEDRRRCPLSLWPAESIRGALLRRQCLGVLLSNPEEDRRVV